VPARQSSEHHESATRRRAQKNREKERIEHGAIDGLHSSNAPGCRKAREGLHHGDGKGQEEPRYQPAPERRDECQSEQDAINDGHKASCGSLSNAKAHLPWRRRGLEHEKPTHPHP
jgi:hypothetical protein